MAIKNIKKFCLSKGFTMVEVLVGIFLFSVFFVGIFGIIQLGIRVASGEQNKVAATAIANGEMEKIKNLDYGLVGVEGGFPSGALEAVKTETISNRDYIVKTTVDYVIDLKDGVANPEDECPNDYKKVQVEVSWSTPFSGSIVMTTNIVASTLSEECGETGGVLSVSVFNSSGNAIDSPLIEVRNVSTDETIKEAIPSSGQHYFSLALGVYKIVVSKDGYSSERTYSIDEVAIPSRPNPQIMENQVTEMSFIIDKTGTFSVSTLSPWIVSDFSDSFLDDSGIESSSNIVVNNGEIILDKDGDGNYYSSGYIVSNSISPASLKKWVEFSWQGDMPSSTSLKFQFFYKLGMGWTIIPNSIIEGNSSGIDYSPIDLSLLDIDVYSEIKVKAILSTSDSQNTSKLYNWITTWRSSGGTPISNILFNMSGEKIIGKDADENPVYKYSEDHSSGSSGNINIANLEPDNYTFAIKSSGINLESIEPSPQPISLAPEDFLSVNLYVESQNSLFVIVKDSGTGNPVFSASVRVFDGEYDITQYTDVKGQVYFAPLTPGSYTLEIGAQGYLPNSTDIYISGEDIETINLEQDD